MEYLAFCFCLHGRVSQTREGFFIGLVLESHLRMTMTSLKVPTIKDREEVSW
jgi:hypothetical protein